MKPCWFLVFVGSLIVGCSPVGDAFQTSSSARLSVDNPYDYIDVPPADEPIPPRTEPLPNLKACTKLDFTGVTWSDNVADDERQMLAVALDITGTFEGASGWANLTDNFDGQGISMGLLQQNLGQGSLQPLWLEMALYHKGVMTSVLSAENLKAVRSMLGKWRGAVLPAMINLRDYGYSELDDVNIVAEELGVDVNDLLQMQSALTSRNQASVNWAVNTILQKGNFKSDWSKQLTKLATTPEYRSMQVERAEYLHRRASGMMVTFKMTQLRSYLFFFDIAVQNGGISTAVRNKFKAWDNANPGKTEIQRLTQLLSLRLKAMTNRTYVNDVKSRKTTLILGKGTVHGSSRNIEKEYCISLDTKI